MSAFYQRHYVAGNMELVLYGDIDADTIMPLLERTFGPITELKKASITVH